MPSSKTPAGKIDRRLLAAASFVRRGAVFADIGTDHAYLPAFLVSSGVVERAFAADINRGPLDRADENIALSGLADRIETRLTDGLCGLEGLSITDIAICGMGGELIARIINDAPWVRDGRVRLILQPMTKAEVLREYLISHGFRIVDEALAESDRVYQIICAEFCGESESYTPLELLLGRHNLERGGALLSSLAETLKRTLNARIEGKRVSGKEASYEEQILEEIKKREL
ncbi:MAG: SAM-dependent methyltransferase [Clostridia bacterium]|nr:SAM-dependent methyltransferase [Clostridia bacterium]